MGECNQRGGRLNSVVQGYSIFLISKTSKPDLIIVDLESLMLNETDIGLLKKQNKKAVQFRWPIFVAHTYFINRRFDKANRLLL